MVLGARATIELAPAACELEPGDIALARRLTPAQRLAESASWNLVATQLEIAGAAARARRP